MLHRVRGNGMERAPDFTVSRQFHATYHVNHDSTGIGRILYRHAQLQFYRNTSKAFALHPQKADLVVLLPSYVIRRTDMDIVRREGLRQHALNGRGLGDPLGTQSRPIEHVEKVSVSAGVKLIGMAQLDAAVGKNLHDGAMQNSRAQLRFDVVSYHWNMTAGKFVRPVFIGDDEDRDTIDQANAGS